MTALGELLVLSIMMELWACVATAWAVLATGLYGAACRRATYWHENFYKAKALGLLACELYDQARAESAKRPAE